ncbi:spindle pole body component 110 [Rosa sericea]
MFMFLYLPLKEYCIPFCFCTCEVPEQLEMSSEEMDAEKTRQDILQLFFKLTRDFSESESQRKDLKKKLEQSEAEKKKVKKQLEQSEAQKNDLKKELERTEAEKDGLEKNLELTEAQMKVQLKVLEQREMQLQQLNDGAGLEKKKANALVSWLAEEYKKCLEENEKFHCINIELEKQLDARKKRIVELKVSTNYFRAQLRKMEEELADREAFNLMPLVKTNEVNVVELQDL